MSSACEMTFELNPDIFESEFLGLLTHNIIYITEHNTQNGKSGESAWERRLI